MNRHIRQLCSYLRVLWQTLRMSVHMQTPEKVGRENERRNTTNPQSRKGIFSLFLKANLF